MSAANQTRPLRVVIACGGTGGHLFPGIAVAQEARRRGWETLLLISSKQIDALAVQGHEDLRFEKVPAVAMPSPLSPAMVKFLWRFWKTRRQCLELIRGFRADAVLGMGGFTSLPPAMAGRKLGLRTFVHESNAVPGKANRMTARFCDTVLLGLEACAKYFPKARVRVTGTPLRSSLCAPVDPREAREMFGLRDDRQTILIMGGSQGARGVNKAVVAALPGLAAAAERVQVLHITGPGDAETIAPEYAKFPGLTAHVAPFCQRMDLAYAVADVAVSRSGASSLTELSAFGVPTILVPYPFAADDHQRRNADVFTAAGAAIAVEEAEIGEGKLGGLLLELLGDGERRAGLAAAMRRLAPGEAAARVCDAIAEG
jgi:UDP-N-acetylglucosamine--N-acetylmuramyl-(pentapeptide) pyrophosphoryl-undecaprenol N-acetylglucosamine transferase